MSEYRLEELAEQSGVSARNIRAYRERGLLDPPRRSGRSALYDESHLAQLDTINQLLRRGFNYSRGFDGAGRLDQGLAFVAYQRSLEKGFLTVQRRLKGEPLEEYILPVGGGFYFTLPGVTGTDRFLGDRLLS